MGSFFKKVSNLFASKKSPKKNKKTHSSIFSQWKKDHEGEAESLHEIKEQDIRLLLNKIIKKVMVCDDAQVNRYLLVKFINKIDSNIIIDEANDGLHAIKLIEDNQGDDYDIIFMDVIMPKIDGYETSRRIKLLKPNVVIIGVTGQIEEDSLKLSHNAGMNICLPKPLQFQTVCQMFMDHNRLRMLSSEL